MPTSPPNWDGVAGMVFCLINRHIPILRVRGLPLSFSAIALLHIYWISGQIAYPINQTVQTVLFYDIRYFSMGIYLPLGIALFHASNIRFLHVAKMQKQYVHPELRTERRRSCSNSSWLSRWNKIVYMKRTLFLIGLGMVLQFLVTIAMWLASKKYHPTYGIPGTEIHGTTIDEQVIYLSRGWEWWPSLFWQVIWTWIVAPIMIWQAWGIHDTMGWRTQTIGCCISSLHATPMFLVATYVPAFEKVNVYWISSQWIMISIMMWEILTVFVPIFHVVRLWALNKKTINSTIKYDSISLSALNKVPSPSLELKAKSSFKSTSSSKASSTLERGQALEFFNEGMVDRMYTMDALEHALSNNSDQLQEFAALSDFSGENIAFLSEVSLWKSYWPESLDEKHFLDAFNQALRIYVNFISTHDAEFPLNISSKPRKYMQSIFEQPARSLFGEKTVDHSSPFEVDAFVPPQEFEGVQMSYANRYTGDIPPDFDMALFNELEDEIKYLILTNTWPKFVESMRRRSSDTERSDFTTQSDSSLKSWISNQRLKIRSLL
ncbi:hypothetical protein N7466_011034 [Penicillium verhagenii]|uniref:uncharacterized protein n=1 Tax=Penicillium verhagenii TaxID=1562060 RepID=UPI0025456B8D|nr:uncharacterized protein N7466_011034 [Penicillium verhagenii]KAJ5917480.1 hypothetical protein N7466_011034 [Penicillium verhagenii]